MLFVKGQKPAQGFFLIFRFFSKYPGHFCYLDKIIIMSAYPSTQHAKRLARAGQGVQYR
tara:strand:+ start:97 stop:273 length:177 start_codon:yes stop_codon:yes gene_type:complete